MGKQSFFDIYTPVSVIDPPNFIKAVESVGEEILRRSTGGMIRVSGSGRTFDETDRSLKTVDDDRLKYYHVSRGANKIGSVAFEHYIVASQLDPDITIEGDIGAQTLPDSLKVILRNQYRLESLQGVRQQFNAIDVVSSKKYPGQRVFVLKQNPELFDDIEARCLPLITVDEHASDRLEEVASMAESLLVSEDDLLLHGIERSIPFARTKETNPELVQQFLDTLTDNLLDPHVTVVLGELGF